MMTSTLVKAVDPISRALATVVEISPAARIRLVSQKSRIEQTLKSLYPLESSSRPALERTLQIATRLSDPKMSDYQQLDLQPLTWRNKSGYPEIGVFGLGDPRCQFAVKRNDWGRRATFSIIPKLPKSYLMQYRDLEEKLKDRQSDRVTLTARWSGLIPLDVKEKIEVARPQFEEIFIWAEVPEWKLSKEVSPRQGDPLVVGFDGELSWLIAAFDLSSIEAYIAAEFAVPIVR